MDSSQREALEELAKCPGWHLFLAHVKQEWGTREKVGGDRFVFAATRAADDPDDRDAMRKLRELCYAQSEIQKLFTWVDTELKAATKADTEFATVAVPNYSRRGDL